jgi:plastocyanin
MKNLISNVKRNILYYSAMLLTVTVLSCKKSVYQPNQPVDETHPILSTERPMPTPPDNMIQRIAMIYKTFNPKILTIKPNTLVIWTNKDEMPHSISDEKGLFVSNAIKMGGSYSYRFVQPGTYTYRCGMHDYEEMIGIIKVEKVGSVETSTLNPN